MPTETKDFVTETFKQAADSFAKTVHAGIRFQEEAAQFWTSLAGKNAEEFRTQWDRLTTDALPLTRRNIERVQKLFDDQAQQSMNLLRKSFEVAQSHNTTEAYEKTVGLWQSSFDAMRQTAESIARTNAETYETWTDMVRTITGATNGGPKAAAPRPAAKPQG